MTQITISLITISQILIRSETESDADPGHFKEILDHISSDPGIARAAENISIDVSHFSHRDKLTNC